MERYDYLERKSKVDLIEISRDCLNNVSNFFHVPWWRIYELSDIIPDLSLDIIVANACLTEIRKPALKDYLDLAVKKLKPMDFCFISARALALTYTRH